MKKTTVSITALVVLGLLASSMVLVHSSLAGPLEDAIAKAPQGTGKGQIDPNAAIGYLNIPGAPSPNLILALVCGLWVGWIFSTVGAFGGILAGVGHITVFGLGEITRDSSPAHPDEPPESPGPIAKSYRVFTQINYNSVVFPESFRGGLQWRLAMRTDQPTWDRSCLSRTRGEPANNEGNVVLKDIHRFAATLLTIFAFVIVCRVENGSAADLPLPKNQEKMEVTIIHVDQYAVFAPNLIFYWDTQLNKQKIAALTSTAERLRNRKAVVVYWVPGDSSRDKRFLLLDIVPLQDQRVGKETIPASQEPGQMESGGGQWGTRTEIGRDEEVPIIKDKQREESEVASLRPQLQPMKSPIAVENETTVETQPKKTVAPESRPMAATADTNSLPITKEEVSAFVRHILDLNQKKDMAAIVSCFADQVNYYDRGIVDRDYIRRDMGYYFKNWDRISSSLEGDVVVIVLDQPDIRIAKFVSSFYVSNARKSVGGRTENIWKIRKIGDELKIIDEKQKLLSSESH